MKNKLKIISIVSIVFAIIIAFTSSVNAVSTTYVTYPEDGGADILLDGKTYHVTFKECSLVYDPGHQYKNYFCYYRLVSYCLFLLTFYQLLHSLY